MAPDLTPVKAPPPGALPLPPDDDNPEPPDLGEPDAEPLDGDLPEPELDDEPPDFEDEDEDDEEPPLRPPPPPPDDPARRSMIQGAILDRRCDPSAEDERAASRIGVGSGDAAQWAGDEGDEGREEG